MTDAAYVEEMEPDEFEEVAEEADAFDPQRVIDNIKSPNLAVDLDQSTLANLGAKVVEEFKIDEESRKAAGWVDRNKSAMDSALQTMEVKNTPWPNASNVKYPLISTAAIQFNARAMPAVLDGPNIVKGKVLGSDKGSPKAGPDGQPMAGPDGQPQWEKPPGEKKARADRIGRHMSYQLLEEMDGWEEDTDKLLMMLPILGSVFRKSYFDPLKGYNCSELVSPDNLVVNYWAKNLLTAPRVTHILKLYPNEIEERFRSEVWLRQDLGQPASAANDDSAPHTFLEQHRLWDLDDDGYQEPYVVTVHEETGQVVRIIARYDEKGVEVSQDGSKIVRIKPFRTFTKYSFIPSPDGAFYDIGFGSLLKPLGDTINTTINQLMDAGTLGNRGGGLIGSGVSMKSGVLTFKPGEWKRVEVTGQTLRESVFPIPAPVPSAVLQSLLVMLIECAKDVTATQDILTGEASSANQAVGTTLAMIEQGLKTFTAIVKRIHRALRDELAVLYRLNATYLEEEAYYTFQDDEGAIAREDYALGDVDVVPVSDPTMATDAQRLARASYLQQFLGKGLDDKEIMNRSLEAAGIPDVPKLWPKDPPAPPPELQIQEKEVQQRDRALDLDERRVEIEEGKATASIQKDVATAQNTMIDAVLKAPEFQAQVAQMIATMAAEAVQEMTNGSAAQVQREDVSGMAGPPANPAVPPVPQGPAGGVGAPMEPGPTSDAGIPSPSDDLGGAGGPEVV